MGVVSIDSWYRMDLSPILGSVVCLFRYVTLETSVPYPFERRSSLRRTPPREILTATPVTTEEIEINSSPEELARKRKREETGRKERHWSITNMANYAQGLEKSIKKLTEEMKTLQSIIKANNNTKKEIKETASKMHFQIEQLNSKKTKEIIQFLKEDMQPSDEQEKTEEYREKDEKEKSLKNGNFKKTCDQGTQTDNLTSYVDMHTQGTQTMDGGIITEVEPIYEFAEFKKISQMKWSNEVYQRTQIKEGNSLDTKDSTVKILLVNPEDLDMEKGVYNLYKVRYPKIKDVKDKLGVIESTCVYRTIGNKPINKPLQLK